MALSRIRLLLVVLSVLVLLVAALVACEESAPSTAPTAASVTKPPIQAAAGAAPASQPASGAPSGAAPAQQQAPPAAAPAKPPAQLKIVPVAANAAGDPNVITATLPGTTTTVAMGATGLPNVSIGVPVTLQGASADAKVPSQTYTWTLAKPTNSKATLAGSDGASTKFTPDVPGVYKVDLVLGNEAGKGTMASTQIRAGTYIGVDQGNCQACHPGQVREWSETGHGVIFRREIDGGADPKTSHYGEGCVRCHTTGYYVGVSNGGFADVQVKTGWKFPALSSIQIGKGNFDAVPAQLKSVANIQCESCHGPAKEHVTSQAPMAVSLDEGVCNVCHNGGGHHVKGAMFVNAKHSEATAEAWTYPTGADHQACVRCHSGAGFISFTKNPKEVASWNNQAAKLSCVGCHDPHSEANKFQLRVVGEPLDAAGGAKDFGLSAICADCHNARTQAADAQKGSYPHYSPAAEMLSNTGGVDYGQKIANSVHSSVVGAAPIDDPTDQTGQSKLFGGVAPGACVACHMWPIPADAKDPNHFKVGDHSFNLTSPDGTFQYTAACQSCHPGVKDFNFAAKADYDGNSRTETVQAEVAGLLKTLQQAISDSGIRPVEGYPYFDSAALAKANEKQKNAIYNYRFVRGLEGSDGKSAAIHNFQRAVMLVQLSYRDLTGKDVPNATLMQ